MLPTYEPALCLLAAVRREITVLALGIWSSRGNTPAEMYWVPWAMGQCSASLEDGGSQRAGGVHGGARVADRHYVYKH